MFGFSGGVHHSRLHAIGIDVGSAAFPAATTFWAGAFGEVAGPGRTYRRVGAPRGIEVFVQRIGDSARIHLDIETDDIEAEASRLEGLGATRERRTRGWWIMADPAGNPFCVVGPQGADSTCGAKRWP